MEGVILSSSRFGIEPDHDDQDRDRHEQGDLTPRQVGHHRVLLLVGYPGEDTLVSPQQVDGGEHHPQCSDDGKAGEGGVAADQHEELTHKAVEARKPDRGERHEEKEAGEKRNRLLQATKVGDLLGVPPVVDHPHQEEQRAGGQAMVHILDHRPLKPARGEGEGAEHDEAQVAHR